LRERDIERERVRAREKETVTDKNKPKTHLFYLFVTKHDVIRKRDREGGCTRKFQRFPRIRSEI